MLKTIRLQRDPERPGITVPARYEVCDDCDGEGAVLHEALRAHAYTMDEFHETFDDEDAAEYMKGGAGIYGVPCPTCHGARVRLMPDEDRLSARQRLILDAVRRQEDELAADLAAERRLRDRECWAAGERP